MYSAGHFRVLVLSVAVFLAGVGQSQAQNPQPQNKSQIDGPGSVHLRWGARPGVTRYRLQLSRDSSFADIVFDRVVPGNDYHIKDISPGRYFWRVASLTTKLGEFSSAAPIEVHPQAVPEAVIKSTRPAADANAAARPPARPFASPAASSIVPRGGWRAAVGDIAHPVAARLRSPEKLDLVGINSEGVVFGLDSASGIALWRTARGMPNATRVAAPLLVRSKSGVDNVVVLSGTTVTAIEGASGHQLWRATLPANAATGAVLNDNRTAEIFVIDDLRQRLFVLDAYNGNILSQLRLPNRVVGAPIPIVDQGARVMIAYESGHVEIRDAAGTVVRSGDAGSPATTPPLKVRGRSGDLILVGTRAGLTALTAEDLRPLGRIAINGDAPRGTLTAQDLDADGFPEVIMMTDRGRVVAVNGTDGKTLWEASLGNETETVAFVDVNGDQVLDVVVAGGQTFASVLSGRDGSVVWKDNEPPTFVGNHAGSLAPRSVIAVPHGSGVLLIAADPARTGLRAVEFPAPGIKTRLNR
jgi:outer membrane protein assembly factor BamB